MNLRFSLIVLIMSVECILISVFTHFMVFYAQRVYQLSSSSAAVIVGGCIVPSGILGAVIGGFLVKKLKLGLQGCTNLILLNSFLGVCCVLVLLLIRCDNEISIGVDLTTKNFNTSLGECSQNCNCGTNYDPICGSDGYTYVSACYAGCKYVIDVVNWTLHFF